MLKDRRHATEKLDVDGAYNGFGYDMDFSVNKDTEPTGRFSYASQTPDHRFSNVNSDFQPST